MPIDVFMLELAVPLKLQVLCYAYRGMRISGYRRASSCPAAGVIVSL